MYACTRGEGLVFISLSSGSAGHAIWPAVCCMGTVNAMVNFKQLYPFGSNLCTN